ncbi:UbiA prenyltransferase family-domain-containing protein [Pseudoneurospora amorphoporcata]|uniref:4-hydroxybenzoate polyprenyltransferase, mitochondrial n=1 Tax=Pseudoneurospora amorphoporcata TaxID=241081 RepID=A0AAN6SIM9_9PEZI|nr:UbiA prenyltransferase family-domain-containing protein [Pseudoneurospora amorphoporcata]
MSSHRLLTGIVSRRTFSHNTTTRFLTKPPCLGIRPSRQSKALTKPRLLSLETIHNYHASKPLASQPEIPTTPTSAVLPTTPSSDPPLPEYTPPTTGLLSKLPPSWVPYAELARLDKPTGSYYLFFPCLFSTLLAAPLVPAAIASPAAVVGTSLLFFSGAIIMRGAGCAINDLWDRNLDPHVTRTQLRPIARRAITPFQGLVFTGSQLLAGLAVLLQFPFECFWYATPSLLFVACYPLAKRVTYYPQFVLGLTFSWGAIMGFPALGVDLLANSAALTAAGCLYTSNIAWTVLYDMIYAHMDIKDDAKAGIKSIALKHDKETKQVLTGLAVAQIALLAGAGAAAGAGPAFFIGSCGGAAFTLGYMIKKVDLKSVKDCWWWFVNGCWITGGVISLGMATDYLLRYYEQKKQKKPEELESA